MKDTRTLILLLVVLLAVLAEILLTAHWQLGQPTRECLPCGSLPRQFVAAHPDCATALARSMNITNVGFGSWPGSETDTPTRSTPETKRLE